MPFLREFLSPCIFSTVPHTLFSPGVSNRSLAVYLAGVAADPEPAAEAPVRGHRVRGAVYGLHRSPVVSARASSRGEEWENSRHHGQGQPLHQAATARQQTAR